MNEENPAELRPDDVSKFLEVFRHAESCPPQRRRSYRELLEVPFKPLNTTLGQLARVAAYFLGPVGRGMGSGVDRLFRVSEADEGVVPTDEARSLERILRVYKSFSDNLRCQFQEQFRPSTSTVTIVRLGCPETIGLRLLASILSDWQNVFPGVDIQITIDNSRLLIPRLHAGLLDLVVAYGPDNDVIPETIYDITFASIGYASRSCLLCHPADPLWTKDGKNLNAGYWRKCYTADDQFSRRTRRETLGFSKLRVTRLDELDFRRTTLITVPTWRLSRQLEEYVHELRELRIPFRQANSYDEALALVRMRLGVTIAPEVFSRRDHVTAFRIQPELSHTRWIGVYYNNVRGISNTACQVAEFVRDYCRVFETQMRGGETPSYGDPRFTSWWSELIRSPTWASRNWQTYSEARYPVIGFR